MKSVILKSVIGLGLSLSASAAFAQSCPAPVLSGDGNTLTYTMGASGEHSASFNLETGESTINTIGPIGGEKESLTVAMNQEVQAVLYKLNSAGQFGGERVLGAIQLDGTRALVYGGDAETGTPGFFAYNDGQSEGCLPLAAAPPSFLPDFEATVLVDRTVINIGNAYNNSQGQLRTCQGDLATCQADLSACQSTLNATRQALDACNARVQELLALLRAKDSEIESLKNQVASAPTYLERNVIKTRRSLRKLFFLLSKETSDADALKVQRKAVKKGLANIKGILFSKN